MAGDTKPERITVSFEELAFTNMVVVESLVELLTEKGLLSRAEIEAGKKVRFDAKANVVPHQWGAVD